ncbi:ATP-binding protein [Glycomyces fuscus]|nr:ATP-binding protein [Glycomyces fuscus]
MQSRRSGSPDGGGTGRYPLPRRGVDPRDRAPLVLDQRWSSLGSALIIEGCPDQAALVRRRVCALSALPPLEREVARELASEVFNNAIAHTRSGLPGGEVVVSVHRLPGRVQVRITDQGPIREDSVTTPCVRPPDPLRVGGLGMRLVAAQASRWGTLHEEGRTTVWFEIDRPDRGHGGPGRP